MTRAGLTRLDAVDRGGTVTEPRLLTWYEVLKSLIKLFEYLDIHLACVHKVPGTCLTLYNVFGEFLKCIMITTLVGTSPSLNV